MEVVIGVEVPTRRRERHRGKIDKQGEVIRQQTLAANRKELRALERWAKRFPERR